MMNTQWRDVVSFKQIFACRFFFEDLMSQKCDPTARYLCRAPLSNHQTR